MSQMLSGRGGEGGGSVPLQEKDEAAEAGINRSISFDTRRQVWAAVEKQWARLTVDDPAVTPTTTPTIKYDQDLVQDPPLYQRIRSWLTSSPSSPNLSTYQEFPIQTKVHPSSHY